MGTEKPEIHRWDGLNGLITRYELDKHRYISAFFDSSLICLITMVKNTQKFSADYQGTLSFMVSEEFVLD